MPVSLQVKLLRALQERVVIKVGDSKPERCDIRVVAATRRNLEERIRSNEFRVRERCGGSGGCAVTTARVGGGWRTRLQWTGEDRPRRGRWHLPA
jgi:hypothetical protein